MSEPAPWLTLLQNINALQERAQASFQKIRAVTQVQVGISQKQCVYRENKTQLYHYAPLTRANGCAPLLICYAMVNRPYLLDLQPDRSLIRDLLTLGFDVYLIDWGSPDGADRFTGLDEYVSGSLGRCVECVLVENQISALNLLGVCQGGTLSLCYTALNPAHVAALITMVTPIDFKTPENLLSKWAQHIDVGLMTESGNVAGEFLNLMFLSLMPLRLSQQKYVNLLQAPGDREQLEHFLRMEKWIFDSPDQPARAFREFVQWFYQENRLTRGDLSLGGRAVRLANIKMPLLNIYARKDHLVPPSACIALGAHIGSSDYETVEVNAGHIGAFVSRSARETVTGNIARWLLARRPTLR